MNPDTPNHQRQELEAKLTALLLGELSAEEAAAVRAAMAQDPELTKLHAQLAATIPLVREIALSPAAQVAEPGMPLKLGEARRQQLLAQFKTVRPKAFAPSTRKQRSELVLVGLAAVLVGLLAIGALLPYFSRSTQPAATEVGAFNGDSTAMADQDLGAPVQHRSHRSLGFGTWALNKSERYAANSPAPAAPPVVSSPAPAANPPPTPVRRLALGNIVLPDGVSPAEGGKPSVGYGFTTFADSDSAGRGQPVQAGDWAVSGTLRGFYDDEIAKGDQASLVQEHLDASKPAQFGVAVAGRAGQGAEGAEPGQAAAVESQRKKIQRTGEELSLAATENQPAAAAASPTAPAESPAAYGRGGAAGAESGAFRRRYGLPAAEGKPVAPASPAPAALPKAKAAPSELAQHKEAAAPAAQTAEGKTVLRAALVEQGERLAGQPASELANGLQAGKAAERGRDALRALGEVEKSRARPTERTPSLQPSASAPAADGRAAAGVVSAGVPLALAAPPALDAPVVPVPGQDTPVPVLGDLPILGRVFRSEIAAGAEERLVPLEPKLPAPAFKGVPFTPAPVPQALTITVQDFDADKSLAGGRVGIVAGDVVDGGQTTDYFSRQTASPGTSDGLSVGLGIEGKPQASSSAPSSSWGFGDPSFVGVLTTPAATPEPRAGGGGGRSEPYSLKVAGYAVAGLGGGITPADAGGQRVPTAADREKYKAGKLELEKLERARQDLLMKDVSQGSEVALPMATMVAVIDKASTDTATPGLGQKLRGLFTGEVERRARVKVERDRPDIAGLAPAPGGKESYDPYFIQTEFETIQSEAVLGRAVKELHLDEAWGKQHGANGKLSVEEAARLLKRKLDLKPVADTSMVDIGVKSDDPAEAARLANAVAEAYAEHRRTARQRLSLGGVEALEGRADKLSKRIEQVHGELAQLEAKLGVSETARKDDALVRTRTNAVAQPPAQDAPRPKPASPPPVPQPEIQTRENAFSTFSLNVSDVSFKLAAASLEKDTLPEPAGIRSEEFINAFDYHDPEAPAGVPVAFTWERAQYPFAQNRDLLRFSLKTAAQGRPTGRSLNLVLLLDNSGSMERADRVQILHEALRVLATQLQPQDKLSVITFARTARLWIDGVPGTQAAQVAEQVGQLTPQGGTNLEEAMNLAYQTALRHYLAGGLNRVVLLTDGAANLGEIEPAVLEQKVETYRRQGIALDAFGIGWEGYNDDLLEVLTRHGDGRYGFINRPEEAATGFAGQLAGALQVAASDVKVQVEFNPARVSAYRQVGYAKHQLTKEQFRDNTVDAAEMAAAEAGNALYVVEVNPRGDGPLATVHIRYKVPGTAEYREHAWSVPFAGNPVPLEQARPSLRLAATAGAFAEWLASSPYAAEVSPARLLPYLNGVPETCPTDPRPKQLEWMLRQAQRVAAK